ncbi:hypothetical protein EV182_003164 [Spiromyces aspiralis]|uniref:Uncharacterized protein n=1 Tax=Spiromyces aspiralis TaxID=68401 RepID=A0ACC1HU74_9FUNG|nr:hypothetical protein EV182_003164 [Spiromyces aspiralis]
MEFLHRNPRFSPPPASFARQTRPDHANDGSNYHHSELTSNYPAAPPLYTGGGNGYYHHGQQQQGQYSRSGSSYTPTPTDTLAPPSGVAIGDDHYEYPNQRTSEIKLLDNTSYNNYKGSSSSGDPVYGAPIGGAADGVYGFAEEPKKRKRGLPEFNEINVWDSRSASSTNSNNNIVDQLIGNIGFERNGVVTVPLAIHLNVSNPNYIQWTINNVTVDGFIDIGSGDKYNVGKGMLPEKFKMPKKSVDNDMVILFNFHLDPNLDNFRQAAQVVTNSCVPNGPPLKFSYDAKVSIKPISSLGIKPKISDTVNFDCPLQGIEQLGISIKDITGG